MLIAGAFRAQRRVNSFATWAPREDDRHAFRRNQHAGIEVNVSTKDKHMGDRSPKANQKKNTQKQNKTNAADQKKQQAAAARQPVKK